MSSARRATSPLRRAINRLRSTLGDVRAHSVPLRTGRVLQNSESPLPARDRASTCSGNTSEPLGKDDQVLSDFVEIAEPRFLSVLHRLVETAGRAIRFH